LKAAVFNQHGLGSKEWPNRLHLLAFGAAILVPLIALASYLATEFAERERARYEDVAKDSPRLRCSNMERA
jgi:hypothetical protein